MVEMLKPTRLGIDSQGKIGTSSNRAKIVKSGNGKMVTQEGRKEAVRNVKTGRAGHLYAWWKW